MPRCIDEHLDIMYSATDDLTDAVETLKDVLLDKDHEMIKVQLESIEGHKEYIQKLYQKLLTLKTQELIGGH